MKTNFEISADKIQDFANFVNPIAQSDKDKATQFITAAKTKTVTGSMRILCEADAFFVGYLRTHGAVESTSGHF